MRGESNQYPLARAQPASLRGEPPPFCVRKQNETGPVKECFTFGWICTTDPTSWFSLAMRARLRGVYFGGPAGFSVRAPGSMVKTRPTIFQPSSVLRSV